MKHRRSLLSVLSLLLSVSLLFTSCNFSPLFKQNKDKERAAIKFSELVYQHPDYDAVTQQIALAQSYLSTPGKERELLALYDHLLESFEQASTAYTLADIRSCLDLNDSYYSEKSDSAYEGLVSFDSSLNELTGQILASEYGDAARKAWGEDFVARYEANKDLSDPAADDLFAAEKKLVSNYREESTAFTVNVDGMEMTITELYESDLDFITYINAVTRYYTELNQEMGAIFLEMLPIREQIADTLGFSDYLEYSYASYNRDFSPAEAASFSKMVKEKVAPLYRQILAEYEADYLNASASYSITPMEAMPVLSAALSEFPPEMDEAFQYMQQYEMYDFSDSDSKMDGAFTARLTSYNTPFLYINPSNSYRDPSTLFHEFGHFSRMYQTDEGGWNSGGSLDLAEVHSQGMELLMLDHYDSLYEETDVKLLRMLTLCDILYAVLAGCLEDEFQQAIYSQPDMSLEEMNRLYEQLNREYFGDEVNFLYGLSWVAINHTFESPLYYISYAVSAAAAFQLWELSLTDRSAALDAYAFLLQADNDLTFRQALTDAGLSDPLSAESIDSLCDALISYFDLPTDTAAAA